MARTAIEAAAPIKRGAKVIIETDDGGNRVGVSGRVSSICETGNGYRTLPMYRVELDDEREVTVSSGRIIDLTGQQRVENGEVCPPRPVVRRWRLW